MNRLHFEHVVSRFNLTPTVFNNTWRETTSATYVEKYEITLHMKMWFIIQHDPSFHIILDGIKTKELAEEILQYIKDTELLFI